MHDLGIAAVFVQREKAVAHRVHFLLEVERDGDRFLREHDRRQDEQGQDEYEWLHDRISLENVSMGKPRPDA